MCRAKNAYIDVVQCQLPLVTDQQAPVLLEKAVQWTDGAIPFGHPLCLKTLKSKFSFYSFCFNRMILHNICKNRKNVNFEIDCLIECCLSGETALIVLDTLEALMQTVKAIEEHDVMQATLPRALEVLLHLLACNESVTVMEHVFATQRSIVVKVKQNILLYK